MYLTASLLTHVHARKGVTDTMLLLWVCASRLPYTLPGGSCGLCGPLRCATALTGQILTTCVLTKQTDELRNTSKGKLYFTWFVVVVDRMGLNTAWLSAVNLNYRGKADWLALLLSCSRRTGCHGKGHEERQDHSQWPSVGLCSNLVSRGPGLPEGNGRGRELCLGQPLFHDLLDPSGTWSCSSVPSYSWWS